MAIVISKSAMAVQGVVYALLLFSCGWTIANGQGGYESAGVSADSTASTMSEEAAVIRQLDWLAGTWVLMDGERKSVEQWLMPEGGIMLGVHRDTRPGKPAFFEYLRIVQTRDGVLQYIASPMGGGETTFTLTEFRKTFVRFENPKHDFPQAIEYERTGNDELTARIAGEGGRGTRSWVFQRSR